ncbi:CRIB domain-containing protein RIC7-like [Triticum urartu]|uniref:CRIB domain-containing protein n=2 Tax=Triticum urartu TaxID=4572 RepID=A0A8R7PDL5_TRIUA|nr:CRIB domain-containing protein RIC7-like [Triticum urartu]
MSTKMKKGILRPFRYFSNIMDAKEQELQIGFPTDVKHVAHIGWDGPSVPNKEKEAGAPSWMKDYHSAPLDSASFRSDRGGSAASNPWASQEIVLDGAGLGDTSFGDTKSEAGGIDVTVGDSPPSPGSRRSRRNRSRGSNTSSMDVTTGNTEILEKKEKAKKGTRKNRKKDKDKAAEDTAGSTCQDLPAVPKKSNRRKNKGSSEGSGGASTKDGGGGPEVGTIPLTLVADEEKDHEL